MPQCTLSFVGCVGGGNVVLSSFHCKRIPPSWRPPDVRLQHSGVRSSFPSAKSSNIFCSVLSFRYSPSQSCFSASVRMIFIWNITHPTNTRILWNLLRKSISTITVVVFLRKRWQFTNLPCSKHEQCCMTTSWTSLPFMSADACTSQSFLLGSGHLANSQTTTTTVSS